MLSNREPIVEKSPNGQGEVPEKSDPEENRKSGNEEPEKVPDLKPNEVVVKKEIVRTEYAPYLIPGDLELGSLH